MSKENPPENEQLNLFDVSPENAKKMLTMAKAYQKALKARRLALEEEVKYKEKILVLIKEAGLTRLADGTIRFTLDRFSILIKPRDELLQVKCKDEEESE